MDNDLICAVVGVVALVAFAALPTIIARVHRHSNRGCIALLNVIGLVIWPAWLVALMWAILE